MLRIIIISCLSLHVASNALCATQLKVVYGESRYGYDERNRGIPCPSKEELIEQAKQEALKKIDKAKYVQVPNSWGKIGVFCDESYAGSNRCVSANVIVEASFVLMEDYDKEWFVHVSSGSRSIPQAEVEAIGKAKIFCNSDVEVLPDTIDSGERDTDDIPSAYYVADFKCIKKLQSRL